MGQYKVPQDVEAEDKLVGPLSLRQFIYVIIGIAWGALMWRIWTTNYIPMIICILPVTGFFLLLGFGRRQEQSFENYFIAWVQFLFVPRIRVWDKDLSQVEIVKAVQKAPEIIPTKNVTRGSLEQLALIMDTHGNQKDPSIQLQDENNQAAMYGQRIVDPTQIAGNVGTQPRTMQVTAKDDIMDSSNAQNTGVNQLIQNVEQDIHQKAIENMQNASAAPAQPESSPQNISQPQTSSAILKKAMLQSNNLNVAQLAREANRQELSEGQSVKISPAN
jgi:hypothetical protein